MKCPKCQQVQADGIPECTVCGVVFSKLKEDWNRQAPVHISMQQAAELPAPSSSPSPRVLLKISGLLGVAAAWYWFLMWAPAGLPVSDAAYRDTQNGFAVAAPDGWQTKNTNECKTMRTPLNTATACIVLNITRSESGGPIAQIMVMPVSAIFKTGLGGSVHITEDRKDEYGKTLEEGIAGGLPGYESEARQIVAVDQIDALQIRGSVTLKGVPTIVGNKTIMMANPFGAAQEHHLTMSAVLVPAGSRAYMLVFGSEDGSDFATDGPFEQVAQSFRIINGRPTPFQLYGGLVGSIMGDAILGALVALTAAILKL